MDGQAARHIAMSTPNNTHAHKQLQPKARHFPELLTITPFHVTHLPFLNLHSHGQQFFGMVMLYRVRKEPGALGQEKG